jgi:microcystin-dependent protein
MPIIPVQNDQLSTGFCPTDYQDLLNTFTAHQFVTLSAITGVQVSTLTPDADHQDLPWLKLDINGRPERLYWFAAGAWLSLHTSPPGTTVWWFNALPNFDTFDGGSAGAVSDYTGPMWQQALLPDLTPIAAQFPIVAGTLPSSLVLAVGDTGGEEDHVLTTGELAEHAHNVDLGTQNMFGQTIGDSPTPLRITSATGQHAATTSAQFNTDTTGNGDGHNNLPPYAVGYLLQRTARLFFAV